MLDLILTVSVAFYAAGAGAIIAALLTNKSPSDIAWLKVAAWPAMVLIAFINLLREDA